MSKLQELIQELCPNGVEWKTIHDVAEIGTGSCNGNEAEEGGAYPFFVRSQNIKAKNDFQYDEEAIIIPGEGGIGEIFHYVNGKYALHQRVYRIHFIDKTINVKFIYYYMKSNFKSFILKKAVSATVTSIRKPMIEKFEIPIPPLEVQEEIVKILDRFADYAAELQAELQARQEQHEFYRDKLLSFNNINKKGGVIWMKMSEIGAFIRGNGLQKKDFTESGVPCIHYGQIYTHYGTFASKTKSFVSEETAGRCKKAHSGDLIFATVSENIEDVCKCVAWLGDGEICISGDSLAFSNNQNPKYLAYYFQTTVFADYKKTRVTGTKVIRLHQSKLEQFIVPIPSLAEQQRIVEILDRFETLTNDLAQGLPAEINAVHEQYKYYRNRLLSFPRNKLSA